MQKRRKIKYESKEILKVNFETIGGNYMPQNICVSEKQQKSLTARY